MYEPFSADIFLRITLKRSSQYAKSFFKVVEGKIKKYISNNDMEEDKNMESLEIMTKSSLRRAFLVMKLPLSRLEQRVIIHLILHKFNYSPTMQDFIRFLVNLDLTLEF